MVDLFTAERNAGKRRRGAMQPAIGTNWGS